MSNFLFQDIVNFVIFRQMLKTVKPAQALRRQAVAAAVQQTVAKQPVRASTESGPNLDLLREILSPRSHLVMPHHGAAINMRRYSTSSFLSTAQVSSTPCTHLPMLSRVASARQDS